MVHTVYNNNHDANLPFVQSVFSKSVQSEEAAYGISCFLQKQTPDWSQAKKAKL